MASLQATRFSQAKRWLMAATAFGWLAGCGQTSTGSAAVSIPLTTAASTTTSSAPVPTASATTATPLSLVGLGDSIPGALHCDAPCRSYVEVLGKLAEKTLGRPVTTTNLATNDSLTSDQLLYRVKKNHIHTDAISKADIITIQIGFNDWQGPCTWSGHAECTTSGSAQVHDNLGPILDQIAKLRNGKPTAIRVVTYYDNTVGDPDAQAAWGFGADEAATFKAWYSSALTTFNTMMCRVAQSHGAVCVNLVQAFNGPAGDRDAGDLVGGDHLHPTQAGQELIASTIDAVGYAPIG